MKSQKRDYSGLIIWASVAVSVPRYIGAFVASDVGNVTGWLSELLTALSLFSGFGMGLLDVIASAYLFDGWRQTLPRLDRKPSLRWWILTAMVIGLMGIGVVILVPYVVARVKHESMEAVMPGAFLYIWSIAVVIAPLFIIGGVSFAQRNVIQSEAHSPKSEVTEEGGKWQVARRRKVPAKHRRLPLRRNGIGGSFPTSSGKRWPVRARSRSWNSIPAWASAQRGIGGGGRRRWGMGIVVGAVVVVGVLGCGAAPTAPYGSELGQGGGISPEQAQAIIDGATLSAGATATRIREHELLEDELTRQAAQSNLQLTRAAMTPTAAANSFSMTATPGAATKSAHATETQTVKDVKATQTQAAKDFKNENNQQQSDYRWTIFFSALSVLLLAALAVCIYYLHQLGRVHIAALDRDSRFKALPDGNVAEHTDERGWNAWRPPLAEMNAAQIPAPGALGNEREHQKQEAATIAAWDLAMWYFIEWGHRLGSYSNSRMFGDEQVVSDDAWRVITELLIRNKIFSDKTGPNKRRMGWAPGWSYERFRAEFRVAFYLYYPTRTTEDGRQVTVDAPSVKSPHEQMVIEQAAV